VAAPPAAPNNLTVTRVDSDGGTLVRLCGVIDETFDTELLRHTKSATVLDLDEVTRITSFGVRQWTQALANHTSGWLGFVNARPTVMVQFNSVHGFAGRGQLVSFYLPYVCGGCGHEFDVRVDVPDQHASLRRHEVPKARCPQCSAAGEFDDLPENYLLYVSRAPPPDPPSNAPLRPGAAPATPFRVKKVVDGVITALWLTGNLDASPRLKRLGDGLEGKVVVSFQGLSQIDPGGVRRLVEFFGGLELPVWLARVPTSLAERVGEAIRKPEQVRLASIRTGRTCPRCGAVFEIDLDQRMIAAARTDVGCPACKTPFPLELEPRAAAVARRLLTAELDPEVQSYLHANLSGPDPEHQTGERHIGRFAVLGSLGVGGMGEVYLARQDGLGGFEKQVVLKSILPHLGRDTHFVKMFLQEARLAARLNHPNVVQIFDVGQSGDTYYIAMEFVRGADLNFLIRGARRLSRPFPVEVALRIAADACAGLHAAHTYRADDGTPMPIIHRDVSPHNVLLSLDGHVKVTDFGIAKAPDVADHTPADTVKGKIPYLAPEQLFGAQVDARSDLYSLTVVLYQMLTLEHPFRRENDATTIAAIMESKPAKASTIRPDLPAEVERLLEWGLKKQPDERVQTAHQFQLFIESVLGSQGDREITRNWVGGMIDSLRAVGERPVVLHTPSHVPVTRSTDPTLTGHPDERGPHR
jgi:serine/threonine protein kinase